MATQSLYRRYRPQKFSELKGQEHIVRALRTSVAEGREGQAYLFSGPRGTGKTTTARIMAKVLNCENPVDGEPCCECPSCLAVQNGTSYDVHELDAASNNKVEDVRDLIEKASLGTPGRHKVYILDEVHMLTKNAEAALLKTLEEPPPHVVFVLATTDPQKMSDTIRSRTQHLQFHLLPADTLDEHVRWVAADAGLEVTDDAIGQVLSQGAGSARDTLSALELVANSGGAASETLPLDEFVEAMVERDPGRALTMSAQAISRGRDPRTLTEELVGFLRNGFLSLMAPELVQLPSGRLDEVTDLARRAGPAALVRGIEQLGAALTEMRHAPDPRVLLDVAIVQLTSDAASTDLGALASRVTALEQRLAEGGAPAPASQRPTAADAAAATRPPTDPSTGRAPLGGRAKRAAAAGGASAPEHAGAAPSDTTQADSAPPADPGETTAEAAAAVSTDAPAADTRPAPAPEAESDVAERDVAAAGAGAAEHAGAAPPAADASVAGPVAASDWETVKSGLRGIGRALFAPSTFVASATDSLTVALPNESHRAKCEQHRAGVEEALAQHAGRPVALELVVGDGPGGSDGRGGPGSGGGGGSGSAGPGSGGGRGSGPSVATTSSLAAAEAPEAVADAPAPVLRAVPDAAAGRAIAEEARRNGPEPDPDVLVAADLSELPDDDDVDLDDLVDAPPETVKSPIDRLAEAFPGSELIDDIY